MGVSCCCSKCELVAFATNVFNRNEVFCSAAAINMAPTPMDFFDLANLLDNDGNLQNEMMVASFAATMLATIPVLLGNEFDVNVGLRKKRSLLDFLKPSSYKEEDVADVTEVRKTSLKFPIKSKF